MIPTLPHHTLSYPLPFIWTYPYLLYPVLSFPVWTFKQSPWNMVFGCPNKVWRDGIGKWFAELRPACWIAIDRCMYVCMYVMAFVSMDDSLFSHWWQVMRQRRGRTGIDDFDLSHTWGQLLNLLMACFNMCVPKSFEFLTTRYLEGLSSLSPRPTTSFSWCQTLIKPTSIRTMYIRKHNHMRTLKSFEITRFRCVPHQRHHRPPHHPCLISFQSCSYNPPDISHLVE